jgi:bacteriocin-like protein
MMRQVSIEVTPPVMVSQVEQTMDTSICELDVAELQAISGGVIVCGIIHYDR